MTIPSDKTRVKRIPKRGIYDRKEIYEILDQECVCHTAFNYQDYPVIIPTIYGRKDDCLYLHGATTSRMLKSLEKGIPISIGVTIVNGIVLARSLFHHSMNYESVVIFGTAKKLESDPKKLDALEVISNQILKGRWKEARKPNLKELKATTILEVKIEEASAKRRVGDPADEKEDYELDIWAGILPIYKTFGPLIPDPLLKAGISESKAALNHIQNQNNQR